MSHRGLVERLLAAPRVALWLKAAVVVFWVAVIAAAAAALRSNLRQPAGKDLNRLAWEATFSERGLAVPPGGPRDGYWGQRMPRSVADPASGWREGETHLPGLIESDAAGLQWAGSRSKTAPRLAILGASVAWGAYASSLEAAYFTRLSESLQSQLGPLQVVVAAAGAWDSENELGALRSKVLPFQPDVVLFLDGLNDVTHSASRRRRRLGLPEIPRAERVRRYLANQKAALETTSAAGSQPVFALQPFLLSKSRKTSLERRILDLTLDKELPAEFLASAYGELRSGLAALCDSGVARCIDLSGLFDEERATTFTDIFHFSDPAHELLAAALHRRLAPILAARRARAHEAPRDATAAARR